MNHRKALTNKPSHFSDLTIIPEFPIRIGLCARILSYIYNIVLDNLDKAYYFDNVDVRTSIFRSSNTSSRNSCTSLVVVIVEIVVVGAVVVVVVIVVVVVVVVV